jgi:hypothetical protein
MAKLYTVSGSTFTKVDSSVIATLPANAQGFYAFPLVTPYPAAAGSILAATVALDCTIASHDTIDVGADGGFNGNAALAGLAYLYASSAWGWHAVTGTVPMVGLLLEDISTSINEIPMNNINVYPNPANFALNINSPSVIGKVSIINTLGQLIF